MDIIRKLKQEELRAESQSFKSSLDDSDVSIPSPKHDRRKSFSNNQQFVDVINEGFNTMQQHFANIVKGITPEDSPDKNQGEYNTSGVPLV